MFGFQKLDVYRASIQFVALAVQLTDSIPRGYGALCDQLKRAALSVSLNIAEGSGRSDSDGRRFYTIARGSALECAAVLDALEVLDFASEDELSEPRKLLERAVSMLTRLARV